MTTFCGSAGMFGSAADEASGRTAAAASTSATVLSAGVIMLASKRAARRLLLSPPCGWGPSEQQARWVFARPAEAGEVEVRPGRGQGGGVEERRASELDAAT